MESRKEFVVIFMGSRKDKNFASKIQKQLKDFSVSYESRAISAHKAPRQALKALEGYDQVNGNIVYIAVAGKSNALGPILSANSFRPVINCPPVGEYQQDLFSSLRTPGGVPCSTIMEPENAAIHAVKILSTSNEELREKLREWQDDQREKIIADDKGLSFT